MIKVIDDTGMMPAKFVSNLFEYSTKAKECSSKVFIKAFVYSSVAFLIDSLDIVSAYNQIRKEKKLTRGNEIYPSYVMAWIGYIMEYFTKVMDIPLTAFYRKIKPEE